MLFSSKVIPGNEKSVGEMFNQASIAGVSINKGTSPAIHASGHAYASEIINLLKFFEADEVIPIHLESSFFQEFISKVKPALPKLKIHRIENYSGLGFSKKYDPLDLKIYLHGGEKCNKSVINNRRRLGNNGALFITVAKDHNNTIEFDSLWCSLF